MEGAQFTKRLDAMPARGIPLGIAIRRAMANDIEVGPNRKGYPSSAQELATYGLLASSAVVLISVFIVNVTVLQRLTYRLRAAHETTAQAEVADSRIEDSDSESRDRTFVDIRFRVGNRTIETQLHRPGRWEYANEEPIDIVYDTRHPRDADFANRLNRKAAESSVRLRMLLGPIFAALGALGFLGFGVAVLANTARYRSGA